MKFWASSETYKEASDPIERIRRIIEPILNSLLESSILYNISLELRYIPIVMPVFMHDKYKERSRAKYKERVCLCAPHLDYEIFVKGSFDQQVIEYVRGISLAIVNLKKFGFSLVEIDEFKMILGSAVDQIFREHSKLNDD